MRHTIVAGAGVLLLYCYAGSSTAKPSHASFTWKSVPLGKVRTTTSINAVLSNERAALRLYWSEGLSARATALFRAAARLLDAYRKEHRSESNNLDGLMDCFRRATYADILNDMHLAKKLYEECLRHPQINHRAAIWQGIPLAEKVRAKLFAVRAELGEVGYRFYASGRPSELQLKAPPWRLQGVGSSQVTIEGVLDGTAVRSNSQGSDPKALDTASVTVLVADLVRTRLGQNIDSFDYLQLSLPTELNAWREQLLVMGKGEIPALLVNLYDPLTRCSAFTDSTSLAESVKHRVLSELLVRDFPAIPPWLREGTAHIYSHEVPRSASRYKHRGTGHNQSPSVLTAEAILWASVDDWTGRKKLNLTIGAIRLCAFLHANDTNEDRLAQVYRSLRKAMTSDLSARDKGKDVISQTLGSRWENIEYSFARFCKGRPD